MKKSLLFSIAFVALSFCSISNINAQGGVGINATGARPDSSAIMDISSTAKGALIPRMTTLQRNAILNPATGLFIYNTDCNVVNYNAGTPASPSWATMSASNVLAAGVSITASPAGAICTGTSVTFSATPSQNNLSPSYQWQVNGSNVGTNSATYTTSNLNNGDVVTCILTSSVNCVTGSPATSNAITVLTSTAPTITGTTSASFCSGSSVSLGASASSGIINWYPFSTGGSSLSTGSSFTISGLTATTTYYVDATANGCTSASRTAVTATYYPNTPNQPGAITGPLVGSRDSAATYSISPVANAATYFWTVTIGIITSGQGTTSINVLWPDTSGTGNVSVVASSPCGTSAAQSIPVSIGTITFSSTSSGRTGTLQSFVVPNTRTYTIKAYGAQGAYYCNSSYLGGQGAGMQGDFTLPAGEVLNILVGQVAPATGGGGGGGTFVVDSTSGNTPLIIAGGGGGGGCNGPGTPGNTGTAGSSGSGGAQGTPGDNGGGGGGAAGYGGAGGGGFCGDGGNAGHDYCGGGNGGNGCVNGTDANCAVCTNTKGLSYLNGGTGGTAQCYPSIGDGGYGGGGASIHGNACGGGGGGYSGGSGGGYSGTHGYGGGGGSYNIGTNQVNSSGVQSGNGLVIINW